MSRLEEQITSHELEALLCEIEYEGYVVVPLRKLYRLLGAGNRAKRTWRLLLDAWEALGWERNSLHIIEMSNERLLLTNFESGLVVDNKWADET